MRFGGAADGLLQRAVAFGDGAAERSQAGAAALGAAATGFDQRATKTAVHHIDQQPRAPVAHVHLARGRGDRPRPLDGIEKVGLAGSHRDLLPAHELDLELEHSHRGPFLARPGPWSQRNARLWTSSLPDISGETYR